jgi:hypothetical protein
MKRRDLYQFLKEDSASWIKQVAFLIWLTLLLMLTACRLGRPNDFWRRCRSPPCWGPCSQVRRIHPSTGNERVLTTFRSLEASKQKWSLLHTKTPADKHTGIHLLLQKTAHWVSEDFHTKWDMKKNMLVGMELRIYKANSKWKTK